MKKFLHILNKHFEEVILVFVSVVMILLIFFQIVARFCLNQSLAWSEELARYCFVWTVWMGVPYAVVKGRHIHLEILSDMVGAKGKFVLDLIFFLVSAAFFGYIGIQSVSVVQGIAKMNQVTPALQIPKTLCYMCLPVGCFLGTFRFLQYGFLRIRRFRTDPNDRTLIAVDGD